MHKFNSILNDIRALGIVSDDVIHVHSSMKEIGEVEGGADIVIDALIESVGEGLLTFPTHTWATMTPEHNIYDRDTEPACVGILPNLFLRREGVKRSLHPTHSVAAFGKGAEEYVEGEEFQSTPCGRNGCYGKLYDLDAKIILLGCGFNKNTFIHGVEEWFGIKERLTPWTLPLKIKMPSGQHKDSPMHKHFKPNDISISEYYMKMEKPLLKHGIIKKGKIGDADCIVINAKQTADFITEYLKKDRNLFLNHLPVPNHWY